MVAVSVIIPVYNAEKYLSECVESLLNQTLVSCEFIFVNDGSTDASQLILEEYSKIDQRIVLIYQENKGVSAARNAGIIKSNGSFITFIDSDDYVSNDYLKVLYSAISSSEIEIVGSNFFLQQNGNWIPKKIPLDVDMTYDSYCIQSQIIPIYLSEDILNPCWGKIYDRDFLINRNIQFPLNMTNGEDSLFCIYAFSKASNVRFIDYCGYYYREVVGSASRDISKKNYLKIAIDNLKFDHKKYADLKIDDKIINHLKSQRFVNNIYSLIHIFMDLNSTISIKERIQNIKYIVNQPIVYEAFQNFTKKEFKNMPFYKRCLMRCIQKQFYIGVLTLSFYSSCRNYNFFQNKSK